jgi:hypothetical protein
VRAIVLSRRALVGGLGVALLTACQRRPRQTPTPTPSPYIGPDLAAQLVGQDVRVRMRVECADFGARGRPTYLRPTCFYDGYFFRLVIPWDRRDLFVHAVRGAPEVQFIDRIVDAHGVVRSDGMWSEIVMETTDQLRIATGWRPPPVPTRMPA